MRLGLLGVLLASSLITAAGCKPRQERWIRLKEDAPLMATECPYSRCGAQKIANLPPGTVLKIRDEIYGKDYLMYLVQTSSGRKGYVQYQTGVTH